MKKQMYVHPESEVLVMEEEGAIAVSDVMGLPGMPFEGDLINDYNETF